MVGNEAVLEFNSCSGRVLVMLPGSRIHFLYTAFLENGSCDIRYNLILFVSDTI